MRWRWMPRAVRWTFSVVAVFLIILEVMSALCPFGWTSRDYLTWMRVRNGAICFFYLEPPPAGFSYSGEAWSYPLQASGWWVEPRFTRHAKWDPEWIFLPRIDRFRPTGDFALWLPVGLPALLFAGAAALMWRRALRVPRPGKCASCGYDRRGLAAGVNCPECGTAPAGGSEPV